MNHLSLFVDKDTFIHRLNPLTKLIYVITIVSIPLILDSWSVFGVAIMCSLLCLLWAGVLRQALPLLISISFLLVTIIIIQSLFGADNETIIWHIGNVPVYLEGFTYAMKITVNMINLILAFALFILTTKPSDFSAAMISWGISPKFAYIFASVFQLIPELFGTMQVITAAQQSRGTDTGGNLWARIKAFFPLFSPVIMNALIATKERAIALEVRGFSIIGPRSHLHDIHNTAKDIIIDCFLLLCLVCVIVWKVKA